MVVAYLIIGATFVSLNLTDNWSAALILTLLEVSLQLDVALTELVTVSEHVKVVAAPFLKSVIVAVLFPPAPVVVSRALTRRFAIVQLLAASNTFELLNAMVALPLLLSVNAGEKKTGDAPVLAN